jgi:hypothetical protein
MMQHFVSIAQREPPLFLLLPPKGLSLLSPVAGSMPNRLKIQNSRSNASVRSVVRSRKICCPQALVRFSARRPVAPTSLHSMQRRNSTFRPASFFPSRLSGFVRLLS